mmetsp:Transcript_8657/g.19023  ORF Transcript_8657/g.19023 Transcript_8657/m.19023 type:complete len:203 (+) Transcript_8657:639-1247(+)
MSSSCSVSFCWASARSFCLSLPEKAAASTMVERAFTMFFMSEVSTWAKEAGFLAISRSMMVIARAMVSMVSTSSASLAAKSADSLERMPVACFSSLSLVEMPLASSSIFETLVSISPVSLPMVASSLALDEVRVLISKPLFVAASSHHAVYSLYAFSSATPSAVIFAASESISSSTLARGLALSLTLAASAGAPSTQKARSS